MFSRNRVDLSIYRHFLRSGLRFWLRLWLRSRLSVKLHGSRRSSVKFHRSRRNIITEIKRIRFGLFDFCFGSFNFRFFNFYFGSFNFRLFNFYFGSFNFRFFDFYFGSLDFRFFGICCRCFRCCNRFCRYIYIGFLFGFLNRFLFVYDGCIDCRSTCFFSCRRLWSSFYRFLSFWSNRRLWSFFDRLGSVRYFVKRLRFCYIIFKEIICCDSACLNT